MKSMFNGLIPDTEQGHLSSAAIGLYDYACTLNEPLTIYKPRLYPDGDMWCALYGENLQDGVAGFGKTPQGAVQAFNKAWVTPLKG
jgi:hypothetical protein